MNRLYRFGVFIIGSWLKLGGVRVIGKENIPKNENIIVICNHLTMFDPPILSTAFPYQLHYVAKEEFAQKAFTRKLFGHLGAIFIKRGESDLIAMRTVLKKINEGKAVGIFPEGMRTFDKGMTNFKRGAAFIAARTGVTVVPVAITNTGDFFRIWKRNIIINVGEPIEIDTKTLPLQELIPQLTESFSNSVAGLLDESISILSKKEKKYNKYQSK